MGRTTSIPAVYSAIIAALALPACTQPQYHADMESDVPAERTLGIAHAAAKPDTRNAHELVSLLDSSDPGLRMLAAQTLKEMSGGQTFGYRYNDPEDLRLPAIKRWAKWADEKDPAPASSGSHPVGDAQTGSGAARSGSTAGGI